MLLGVVLLACAGCASQEAAYVSLPVEADATGIAPSTNELGWTVAITRFRAAVEDVNFTTAGEMHAGIFKWLRGAIISEAHAHPGHYAGGDVIGELPGKHILDLSPGAPAKTLGTARLLVGRYRGANFMFRRAEASELPQNDALVGHTAWIEGTADKGGRVITFRAAIDLDAGTQVVGLPFDREVGETAGFTIGLRPLAADPYENKSLFQKLDFAAYDHDGDGRVDMPPGAEANNILRRTLQVHDYYVIATR